MTSAAASPAASPAADAVSSPVAGPGGAAKQAGSPAFEDLARRVDEAARAVANLDEPARRAAHELRAAIEAAHRDALITIVRRLRAEPGGRGVLFELVDDPLVRMLFSLHGIIRPDPVTEPVRPAEPTPVLIPLSAVRRRDDASLEPGWVKTLSAGDVPEGAITQLRLVAVSGAEQDAIVVRIDGRLTAYKDECAHQGLPLGGGLLDPAAGTLTCPWHGYCYDALSGECMSAPGAALERLPLRVEDGHVWIRAG